VTELYKVTLHPKFKDYYPLNDLEVLLRSHNLLQLLPETRHKTTFDRTKKELAKEHGLKYKLLKKTHRDLLLEIRQGRKSLGTFMIQFNQIRPSYNDVKVRSKINARLLADREFFQEIVEELKKSLLEMQVNSYTFHLKTLRLVDSLSVKKEIRPNVYRGNKDPSEYFFLEPQHLPVIEGLKEIYSKFQMEVRYELVDTD
jgi:hypothetical protein